MFTKETSDKRLLSKIYKELLKLINKKINNMIQKHTKDLNTYPIKGDTEMVIKYMKSCSTSYVIREMQTKTRYHYTPIKITKIQKTNNTKC